VYLSQIDVVFSSQYTLLESVQAHSTSIVNLVASTPLDSSSSNVLSCRQRLISVGEDGEVRVWAIQLQDDLLHVVEHLHPVKLQLLFQVCFHFRFIWLTVCQRLSRIGRRFTHRPSVPCLCHLLNVSAHHCADVSFNFGTPELPKRKVCVSLCKYWLRGPLLSWPSQTDRLVYTEHP